MRNRKALYVMKKLMMGLVAALLSVAAAAEPRVENVRARQIPDTKDVEVTYDLVASDGGLFKVSATFQAPGVAPEVKTVTGDFGSDVAPGRNRRFVWDAGTDWPDNVNSNFICTVSAEEQLPGVQLWEGGPYWAECNVGATKPEEYGLYFWWGDTVGHKKDGRWFDPEICPTYGKSDSQLRSAGYIDSTGNLVSKHDAATAHLGSPWRMPTDAEMAALIRNCTTTWTTRNGIHGRLVKGKGDYSSRSIFLPAAGFCFLYGPYDVGSNAQYWLSTPTPDIPYGARSLYFSSGDFKRGDYGRHGGQPVRPVRDFAQ